MGGLLPVIPRQLPYLFCRSCIPPLSGSPPSGLCRGFSSSGCPTDTEVVAGSGCCCIDALAGSSRGCDNFQHLRPPHDTAEATAFGGTRYNSAALSIGANKSVSVKPPAFYHYRRCSPLSHDLYEYQCGPKRFFFSRGIPHLARRCGATDSRRHAACFRVCKMLSLPSIDRTSFAKYQMPICRMRTPETVKAPTMLPALFASEPLSSLLLRSPAHTHIYRQSPHLDLIASTGLGTGDCAFPTLSLCVSVGSPCYDRRVWFRSDQLTPVYLRF